MLTCYRIRRRIGAYLDGALAEGESAVAAAHITTCARCQAELDALRRLSAMLRGVRSPALPEWTGFWEGVRRGIETSRVEAAARVRPVWRWRPGFAVGAAAALVIAVSVALWQMPPGPLGRGGEAAVSVSSADTDAPGGGVMVYTPPEKDLAVVWLFTQD